jgi:hypothetical protein
MIKRNDIWALSLGAVQLALFAKLLTVVPSNVLTPSYKQAVLPPNAFGQVAQQQTTLQPFNIMRFAAATIALFLLFINIGKLTKLLSAKDEALNGIITQIINASAGILVLILVTMLFQGF